MMDNTDASHMDENVDLDKKDRQRGSTAFGVMNGLLAPGAGAATLAFDKVLITPEIDAIVATLAAIYLMYEGAKAVNVGHDEIDMKKFTKGLVAGTLTTLSLVFGLYASGLAGQPDPEAIPEQPACTVQQILQEQCSSVQFPKNK